MEHTSNNIPSHSKTRNVGGNGNNGGANFDIASEIKRLQAFYNSLSREKNQILLYLAEVYKTAKGMRTHKRCDVLQQINEELGRTLDARIARNLYRILIELTCTCNIKLRSRYANALTFAQRKKCTSSQLITLIKKNGGIEKCARAYLLEKRQAEKN
ncbi:MAG: hypothetical protein ABSD31_20795 [Candidatus Binataceae bacterium]|jgi:hypothetical protein